jgi:hypothetical protein
LENSFTVKEWITNHWFDFDNRAKCINACAKEMNKAIRTARKVMISLETAGIVNWNAKKTFADKTPRPLITGAVATLSFLTKVPVTVEDLVEIAKLDPKVWEVDKGRVGFWGNEKNGNYQHRCEYRRKYPVSLDFAIEFINTNFKPRSSIPVIKLKKDIQDYLMAEIMLPDLHLGRVNTRGTANLEEVKKEFETAINYFIENVLTKFSVGKVVLVLGNDFYNSSSNRAETYAGTQQTEHPIWEETFTMGTNLAIDTVEKIQQVSGVEVEVIICVANHDFESSYYLGQILSTYFRNNTKVLIQGNLENFKFVKFGTNLIGYTHKCPAKTVSLPLLMADKRPYDWASSKIREWHVAHIHHKTTLTEHQDVNGVRIKSFPTITAHSDWENERGYISKREGTLLLWDSNRGCVAEFYYKNNEE